MDTPLRHLRRLIAFPWRRVAPEVSRLVIGSTGSGKSEGELVELVRLARRQSHAVVLLDGHGPLAFRATGHWAARGHESRIIAEPLRATDRVLSWTMLPPSSAPALSDRLIEDAETRDEVVQCFLAPRNLQSLNDRAWTKEWLEAAISLCLAQRHPEPLSSLLSAFHIGSADYERLLQGCENPAIVAKFRDIEVLKRRSIGRYEDQTGPARRFLELLCTSEVVRLRSRPGTFDWRQSLRERQLIAFDGGGIRSREVKRTMFLLVSLQVIQAIRRHFARTQEPLPVVLVLEEAGALGLVAPFLVTAMQELRKAGLSVHLLTQSCLDFGDRDQFEALLAHTPWQAWYQSLSPADQDLGARALSNATFDAHAVHFARPRQVIEGASPVLTESRGEIRDALSGSVRQERRTGMTFLARRRTVDEAYYKTPQLHEQEFRTKLATLRIGERLVRDRNGVRQERVQMLRPPRVPGGFAAFTHAAIARIRSHPRYLPPPPEPAPLPGGLSDAAARLRGQSRRL